MVTSTRTAAKEALKHLVTDIFGHSESKDVLDVLAGNGIEKIRDVMNADKDVLENMVNADGEEMPPAAV